MYQLKITRFIDAAHRLPDTEDLKTKKCANLHGHTYAVRVHLEAHHNAHSGMVVDFKEIKDIIDKLDHQFINDIFLRHPIYENLPTTAENIAKFYWQAINALSILKKDAWFVKVEVCEGYKGEDSSWVTYEA